MTVRDGYGPPSSTTWPEVPTAQALAKQAGSADLARDECGSSAHVQMSYPRASAPPPQALQSPQPSDRPPRPGKTGIRGRAGATPVAQIPSAPTQATRKLRTKPPLPPDALHVSNLSSNADASGVTMAPIIAPRQASKSAPSGPPTACSAVSTSRIRRMKPPLPPDVAPAATSGHHAAIGSDSASVSRTQLSAHVDPVYSPQRQGEKVLPMSAEVRGNAEQGDLQETGTTANSQGWPLHVGGDTVVDLSNVEGSFFLEKPQCDEGEALGERPHYVHVSPCYSEDQHSIGQLAAQKRLVLLREPDSDCDTMFVFNSSSEARRACALSSELYLVCCRALANDSHDSTITPPMGQ